MSNDPRSTIMEEPPLETPAGKAARKSAARPAEDELAQGAGASETKAVQPGPPRSVWREYFESLVVTAIMALFGMTFVVQAVKVPTGSMQNTITIGDHLLVNKFIFAPGTKLLPFLPQREIRRGDIVVFKYPGNPIEPWRDIPNDPGNRQYITNYVKRVIGLPGDRIELRGTSVIINGEPLKERVITAINHQNDPSTAGNEDLAPLTTEADPPPQGEGPYTVAYSPASRLGNDDDLDPLPIYKLFNGERTIVVPPDSYFMMGDNRDNSFDSRYWGFVPRDLIIGRALFVYWSYDESAPSGGFPYIQDFFRNTRWGRTGAMIK
ncbi:MAG TPA: signal peptidase I [Pyrinomonadaceae bacterium]|nr:signal peptidase I [Pyrinomonadaceae bacterium]